MRPVANAMPGRPRDLSKPFVYQTRFTITSLVTLPGPGAFPVPSGLRLEPVADLARTAPLATRRYPWARGIPGERKETTRLTLPASMHILAMPKDGRRRRQRHARVRSHLYR